MPMFSFMRTRAASLALVLVAMASMTAYAVDPLYQYKRKIFFPIPSDRLAAQNPQPAAIRLWYAAPGQTWRIGAEKNLNALETNGTSNQRGLFFTAPDDGEYEFASQQVYADGGVSPRENQLSVEARVIFDSKPPQVNITVTGNTSIEWDARDEYLTTDPVSIEARYKDTKQSWTKVKDRLRAMDRYSWSSIPAGYTLEVRIVARDKAGNEGYSRIITLPSNGSNNTGSQPSRDGGRWNDTPSRSATSYGDDFPNRPEVQYVNKKSFDVTSKITRITKSGVGKVVLWSRDDKGVWQEGRADVRQIQPDAKDPQVNIPFEAPNDGLYEFRVVPWSNATLERGEKLPAPNKTDPAQILVRVDTKAPDVFIRSVKVLNSLSGLPKVEIDYEAKDENLIVETPVLLEWSKDKINWTTISRVKRDGMFTWDNIPDNEWKIFIRARAQDKASNEGSTEWKDPVYLDLERPEATIERINGTGSGGLGVMGNDGTKAPVAPPVNNNSRNITPSGGVAPGNLSSPTIDPLLPIPDLNPSGLGTPVKKQ